MARSDDDESGGSPGTTHGWSRRRVLGLIGGSVFGAGAARVVYELLGFGTVTGTNLTEQELGPIARRHLEPSPFALTFSDRRLVFDGTSVGVETGTGDRIAGRPVPDTTREATASVGAPTDPEARLGRLATDLGAIEAGRYTFEFTTNDVFFDRLRDAQTRPVTVAALRSDRFRRPSRETVRRFAGVAPRDPAALVAGLAEGFRRRTHFDTPRYVAGNVQDHLLGDAVSLRQHVRGGTEFEGIVEGSTGLYCYEYTLRSIEAFHAVAPHQQVTPVFGAYVSDRRHNHAFTGLASVVRENGSLRIPMTFLDYSHSTMYDTYHLRGVFGDGVDAYDERHRASRISY
ncbi:hypothetical protein [Salinigranum salinum]|uniref:hypothetical protein n=1 Tax=Salinigranum salinum TaxID=1364937 RepID=UPI0012605C62|nr:hypothetical protein [Salinigranum salinum]